MPVGAGEQYMTYDGRRETKMERAREKERCAKDS